MSGPNNSPFFLEQTFGVDLEARARADRKRVPIIVTTILTFLDNRESGLAPDITPTKLSQTTPISRVTKLVEVYGW